MGSLSKLQTVRGRAVAETAQQRTNRLWYSPEGFVLPDSAYYVTPELAMTLTHVYSAVDIISSDFGVMTCQLFRDMGEEHGRAKKSRVRSSDSGIGRVAYQLRWQPNAWQTAKAFWSTMAWQYLMRPFSFAEIVYRPGSDSWIDQLVPRHPDRIRQERLPSGRLRFKVTGEPDGKPRYITQDEAFIVRNTSTDGLHALSRIGYGAQALAAGLALQEFTRNYFENGATAALIATYKGGRMEEPEEAALHARISRFINGSENAGGIFVTDEDLSVSNLGVEPEKAQLLGLKNISGRDVARLFKIPPSWLAIEGAQSYNSSVQDTQNYAQRCQTPIVVEFEQAIYTQLIVAQEYFAKFNMDYITRATLKERMESYEIGIRARVIRPSEAREREDLEPDIELDELSALDHRAGSQRDGADNKPKGQRRVPAAAAVRTMLYAQDNAQRILRREKGAVEKIAKKHADNVDGWQAELKAFYADHAGVIAETMRLPIDTARAVAARHGQTLADRGIVAMDANWEREETEALVTLAMDSESSFERLAATV